MQIQAPADLAHLVKTQRQAQGLTQQDVADAAGITRQSLARIEQGHGGVSVNTVLRIFERLSIRLDAATDGQRQVRVTLPDVDALREKAAAAASAMQDVDLSSSLSGWQRDFRRMTDQLQEETARRGTRLTMVQLRRELLDAAIEAGDPDPDRDRSTADRRTRADAKPS